MATKSSNQMTNRELEVLQREAQQRMKIADEVVYEELVDGIIVDPYPYKIKTAQFYYCDPGSKYLIWAETRPGKKSVRKKEVFLISSEYFKKYPECCSPLASGTEDVFLKYALFPMFQKRASVQGSTLQ